MSDLGKRRYSSQWSHGLSLGTCDGRSEELACPPFPQASEKGAEQGACELGRTPPLPPLPSALPRSGTRECGVTIVRLLARLNL